MLEFADALQPCVAHQWRIGGGRRFLVEDRARGQGLAAGGGIGGCGCIQARGIAREGHAETE